MSNHSSNPQLDATIAAYLQSEEAGTPLDPQELIEKHPELAAELESFFANHFRASPSDQEETVRLSQPSDAGTPSDATVPALRRFGDYELIEEIARGGMGVVFRARQLSLQRTVALKMILAGQLAGEEDVRRFHAEAEAAANLDHPGIVPIHEVGEEGGQHYFSMGFVEGQSLADRLQDGPLPPDLAATLTEKIARAIAYAHERGVIHRDLKPANVLLDGAGEPRVTDFGLAKQIERDSGLTATGQILGTPSYMPPEQAAGKLESVTEAADVYSLGAVLYALLTGRPPFQTDNHLDTLMQVLEKDPVPPQALNHAVPLDLQTICLKCLSKDPSKRYASAGELAEDLLRFREGHPILARPIGRMARTAKWIRRRPVVALLLLGFLLSTLSGLIVSVYFAQVAQREAGASAQAQRAAERESASLSLLLAADAFDKNQVDLGLLYLAKCLRAAPQDAKTLRRVAMSNLAIWRQQLHSVVWQGDHCQVVISENGKRFVVISRGPSKDRSRSLRVPTVTRVFDLPSGKQVCEINDGSVSSVANTWTDKPRFLSPDGRYYLSPAQDAYNFWDCATGKALGRTSNGAHSPLLGKSLVGFAGTEGISIWKWNGEKVADKLAPSMARPRSATQKLEWGKFSPDEKLLCVSTSLQGNRESTFEPGRSRSIEQRQRLQELQLRLVTKRRRYRLYRTADGELYHQGSMNRQVGLIQFSADGKRLVLAESSELLAVPDEFQVFETSTGKEVRLGIPATRKPQFVRFSTAADSIYTVETGDAEDEKHAVPSHRIRTWRLAPTDGRKPEPPVQLRAWIKKIVDISPDRKMIYFNDGTRFVAANLTKQQEIWDGPVSTKLSPNCKHAVAASGGQMTVRDATTGIAVTETDLTGNFRAQFVGDRRVLILTEPRPARTAQFPAAALPEPTDSPSKLFDVLGGGRPLSITGQHGRSFHFAAKGEIMIGQSAQSPGVRFWDTRSGTRLGKIAKSPVFRVRVDAVRSLGLALAAYGRQVRIHRISDGKLLRELDQGETVVQAVFSPKGEIVAVGGANKLCLFKVPSGTKILECRLPTPVRELRFAPDGRHLVVLRRPQATYQTRIIQLSTKTERIVQHPQVTILAGLFGDQLVLYGKRLAKTELQRWDLTTGESRWTIDSGPADRIEFDRSGRRIELKSTTVLRNVVRMIDVETGDEIRRREGEWPIHSRLKPLFTRPARPRSNDVEAFNAAGYSATGPPRFATAYDDQRKLLCTARDHRTARIWDAETGQLLGQPLRHRTQVVSIKFLAGSGCLLTSDGNLHRLWRIARRQLLLQLSGSQNKLAVLDSDLDRSRFRSVRIMSSDTARIVLAKSGEPIGKPLRHAASIVSVALNREGTLAATASADRSVRIWDAETGHQIGPALIHDDDVAGVAFRSERVLLSQSDQVYETRIPPPLDGDSVQTARWVEAIVGGELDSGGGLRIWSVEELEAHATETRQVANED